MTSAISRIVRKVENIYWETRLGISTRGYSSGLAAALVLGRIAAESALT